MCSAPVFLYAARSDKCRGQPSARPAGPLYAPSSSPAVLTCSGDSAQVTVQHSHITIPPAPQRHGCCGLSECESTPGLLPVAGVLYLNSVTDWLRVFRNDREHTHVLFHESQTLLSPNQYSHYSHNHKQTSSTLLCACILQDGVSISISASTPVNSRRERSSKRHFGLSLPAKIHRCAFPP